MVLKEGFTKNQYRGGLPKRGAWKVCRFKGGLARKRGGVFEGRGGGGVDTPIHNMYYLKGWHFDFFQKKSRWKQKIRAGKKYVYILSSEITLFQD